MKIEKVRQKTSKSNEKLDLAQQLALEALRLPEDSNERKKLEAQAQKLVDEARELTDTAKQEISRER
jgi:hypothetical protein